MSLTKKYPLPVYDPPASYRNFDGGINTSLSNESLQPNELRDALNCHYSNGALINRPGASKLKTLLFPDKTDTRPQGDFLWATPNNTWIISVRNGHIYFGDFGNSEEVTMNILTMDFVRTEILDTENYIANLDTYTDDYNFITELMEDDHEGFIYKFKKSMGTGEALNPGEDIDPVEDVYEETLIIQNTKRVQGIPVSDYFIMATGTRILKISEINYGIGTDQYMLKAEILGAKRPPALDYSRIGPNFLSPFPYYHIADMPNSPITQLDFIMPKPWNLTTEDENALWEFKTIASIEDGFDKSDFFYKWEVKYVEFSDSSQTNQTLDTEWKTVWYWDEELNKSELGVEDGKHWSKGKHTITLSPAVLKTILGRDITAYDPNETSTVSAILVRCTITNQFESHYDTATKETTPVRDIDGDLVSLQASARHSRTHQTFILHQTYTPSYHDVDQYFYYIHSCTKVTADGQKALFYDDAYNTGSWFKTVISQYDYITKNMSLCFKTTKNESLVAVAVFDTNIVVFADNEQLGGNISVVTGNGDDYNKDDYYSPYQRKIVNSNVSCDAYNSMQIADNFVIFKYRKDIYILDSTGLSNTDTVKVETINDMIKQPLGNIELPLERIRQPKKGEKLDSDFHGYAGCLKPDEIFSEIEDGCYSLILPHQGHFSDTDTKPSEDTVEAYKGDYYKNKTNKTVYMEKFKMKPGLKWKCYFRNGRQYSNTTKIQYPWLRDVSYLFDITGIIHVEGYPCYVLSNGDVIRFDRDDGTSYTQELVIPDSIKYMYDHYKMRIITKAYDMEAPALCKFLDSACIYYNRGYTKNSKMDFKIYNEADYEIYSNNNEAFIDTTFITDQLKTSTPMSFDDILNYGKEHRLDYVDPMDKPVQILSKGIPLNTATLNRPNFASKTLTPKWRFPFLSCSVEIELLGNQAFTLSGINFSYTSSDLPDFTREKLYREIIRQ